MKTRPRESPDVSEISSRNSWGFARGDKHLLTVRREVLRLCQTRCRGAVLAKQVCQSVGVDIVWFRSVPVLYHPGMCPLSSSKTDWMDGERRDAYRSVDRRNVRAVRWAHQGIAVVFEDWSS